MARLSPTYKMVFTQPNLGEAGCKTIKFITLKYFTNSLYLVKFTFVTKLDLLLQSVLSTRKNTLTIYFNIARRRKFNREQFATPIRVSKKLMRFSPRKVLYVCGFIFVYLSVALLLNRTSTSSNDNDGDYTNHAHVAVKAERSSVKRISDRNSAVYKRRIAFLQNVLDSFRPTSTECHHEITLKAQLVKSRKSKIIPELDESVGLQGFKVTQPSHVYHSVIEQLLNPYRHSKDSFERFYNFITNCQLYSSETDFADLVLRDLRRLRITKADIYDQGTQVKVIATMSNGKKAVMKPLRTPVNEEPNENVFYWREYERSNAEIAAFNLDRLLNFNRAPPTVGRVIDLQDLKKVASKKLLKTFFHSPAGNLCFTGKCDYYCDSGHPVCGNPTKVSFSVQMWLPDEKYVEFDDLRSPFRRTYSRDDDDQLADWQKNSSICKYEVKPKKHYRLGRRLLDIIDVTIFDYLIGNQDRHHFEFMWEFDINSNFIHMDNGRGFGRTDLNYTDILAPLYQCCVIRPSTLRTLIQYAKANLNDTLSEKLKRVLAKDQTAPVLGYRQFSRIEERLDFIMIQLEKCLKEADEPVLLSWYEYDNSTGLAVDSAELSDDDEEDEEEEAKKG